MKRKCRCEHKQTLNSDKSMCLRCGREFPADNEDKRFGRIVSIIMKALEIEERHTSIEYEEYKKEVLEFDDYLNSKYCEGEK